MKSVEFKYFGKDQLLYARFRIHVNLFTELNLIGLKRIDEELK